MRWRQVFQKLVGMHRAGEEEGLLAGALFEMKYSTIYCVIGKFQVSDIPLQLALKGGPAAAGELFLTIKKFITWVDFRQGYADTLKGYLDVRLGRRFWGGQSPCRRFLLSGIFDGRGSIISLDILY